MQGSKCRVDQIRITGRVFQIEQRLFELIQELRRFLTESGRDRCRSCTENLAYHRQQLFLLERLGDPSGGACGFGFLLHARGPIWW